MRENCHKLQKKMYNLTSIWDKWKLKENMLSTNSFFLYNFLNLCESCDRNFEIVRIYYILSNRYVEQNRTRSGESSWCQMSHTSIQQNFTNLGIWQTDSNWPIPTILVRWQVLSSSFSSELPRQLQLGQVDSGSHLHSSWKFRMSKDI